MTTPSHAGILDFKLLGDAKKAYENSDFKQSTLLYQKYLKEHDSNEANYDLASSLYKNKKYTEAAGYYQKIHFTDKVKQADCLYNLANTYAKSGEFQQAIDTYTQSLALKSDKDAKTNKEIVEKLLKKQQEQKKQQDKENQDKKNQDNNQQNNDKNKENQNQSKNDEQSNKDEQKNSSQKNQENSANSPMDDKMSAKEEQKWLQRLNTGTPTHMYKLDTSKTQKDSKNEKPW